MKKYIVSGTDYDMGYQVENIFKDYLSKNIKEYDKKILKEPTTTYVQELEQSFGNNGKSDELSRVFVALHIVSYSCSFPVNAGFVIDQCMSSPKFLRFGFVFESFQTFIPRFRRASFPNICCD